MRTLRVVTGVCMMALLFLISCSTISSRNLLREDPEFVQGYDAGIKMAEKDRVEIDCSDPRLGSQGMKKAQKYNAVWREQAMSEIFISGFSQGYNKTYRDNLDLMCD